MAEEEYDEGSRSIIMDIIGQLRKGSDIHRISLPTFVLEPRSMCERLVDFFSFQELLHKADEIQEGEDRLIQIIRYFLSGWRQRPKGVKKPFNPILGEFHRCSWTEYDGTEGFYICEQVCHHPPISAFFYGNPQKGIAISGELHPRAKFLGNSASTVMEGGSYIYLDRDEFQVTNPNIYARNILFGTMYMELGDSITISSVKSDLKCSIDFKQLGTFGFGASEKDAISGKIVKKSSGQTIYKLSGKWSDKVYIKNSDGSNERVLYDGSTLPPAPKRVTKDECDLEEFESTRLWKQVSIAVKQNDHATATKEKTKIEENQRLLVKTRTEKWESRFFQKKGEKWELCILDLLAKKPQDPKLLRDFIFAKPSKKIHEKFWVSQ